MRIRFKSEEHKRQFTNLCDANVTIAEFMGLFAWPAKRNRKSGKILEIVDPKGELITVGTYNCRIYPDEHRYFEIQGE